MKTEKFVPIESSSTTVATININDVPVRTVGSEEILYEEVIKIKEELKRLNKRIDEILGEKE